MLTKTQAIVLHSLKFGESRLIVDLFTRTNGRLSFIVSIPKTAKAKIKKQFFQPLTLLNIEADLRPNVQLQKIRDAQLLSPLSSIPFDSYKLSMALFISEFLYYGLRNEQRNEPLFDYILNSIEWLDNADGNFSNFHLVFLMRLSRFLGFYPNLDDYAPRDYFDLRQSCFVPAPPLHRDFLDPDEAEKVQLMMRMNYPTMHVYRMNRLDRVRLLEIAITYYRLHLPDFPDLKSLDVLKELYQ